MTMLEGMRLALIKAGYSRSAAETALADPKRLRDEFAMAAMQGYIAHYGHTGDPSFPVTARIAYDMADAMTKARLLA